MEPEDDTVAVVFQREELGLEQNSLRPQHEGELVDARHPSRRETRPRKVNSMLPSRTKYRIILPTAVDVFMVFIVAKYLRLGSLETIRR